MIIPSTTHFRVKIYAGCSCGGDRFRNCLFRNMPHCSFCHVDFMRKTKLVHLHPCQTPAATTQQNSNHFWPMYGYCRSLLKFRKRSLSLLIRLRCPNLLGYSPPLLKPRIGTLFWLPFLHLARLFQLGHQFLSLPFAAQKILKSQGQLQPSHRIQSLAQKGSKSRHQLMITVHHQSLNLCCTNVLVVVLQMRGLGIFFTHWVSWLVRDVLSLFLP